MFDCRTNQESSSGEPKLYQKSPSRSLSLCLNFTFSGNSAENHSKDPRTAGKHLPAQSSTPLLCPHTHLTYFMTLDMGHSIFNTHNFSESWWRTNPYPFQQPVIFISANLRVSMHRYKPCVVRYHCHLQTCPLKIRFLIFRTDLGSGFHKCSKIKPLPLQIRCQGQQWSLNQKES